MDEGFPAKCMRCGAPFPVQGLIGGTGTIHMSGMGTVCPFCGGPARILDGSYSLNGTFVSLISARDPSEVLRVTELVRKSVQSGDAPRETVKKIQQVDASFADAIKPFSIGDLIAFFTLLITLAQFIHSWSAPAAVTKEDLAEFARQVVIQQGLAKPGASPNSQDAATDEPVQARGNRPKRVNKKQGKQYGKEKKAKARSRR